MFDPSRVVPALIKVSLAWPYRNDSDFAELIDDHWNEALAIYRRNPEWWSELLKARIPAKLRQEAEGVI